MRGSETLILLCLVCRLKCFNCKQYWTGATFASMGTECAAFIYNEFPDDEELKIEALGVKRIGLADFGDSSED
jgi:hypothetical protein